MSAPEAANNNSPFVPQLRTICHPGLFAGIRLDSIASKQRILRSHLDSFVDGVAPSTKDDFAIEKPILYSAICRQASEHGLEIR